MATNKALDTYNTLIIGHAKAIGITNLENMTDEEKNRLEHRLAEHGVVKPESAPALPGSADIPSAGNEEVAAIAPTTKGRAKKVKSQPPATTVSPADFNDDVLRVFQHMAQQGDRVGEVGMQIFEGAVSRRVQDGMLGFTLRATKPIEALAVSANDFLDSEGY
jgi:hypothetical protein